MPWQNNNGGGPKNSWGQGPQGRGPQPPNIDDILKKGQQRLKDTLPGGSNGLWIGLAVLVFAWIFACIATISQEERGVVLRFGAYDRILNPGLNVILWPVEQVVRVPVERRFQTDIGLRPAESLMLTGDENIVDIKFTVFWHIDDPQDYIFNIQNPQEVTVRAIAESAIREVIGKTEIDYALTDGKADIQAKTAALIQDVLNSYDAGIGIEDVNLDVVDPPQQVAEAFRDVQKAEADKERFQNEADRYRFQVTLEAQGEAAKIREAAQAYKQQAIAKAQGEASRFSAVYNEYKLAKDVTKKRIYLETMEEILGGMDKVILDANSGSGIVPYLPLPEIQKRREGEN